MKSKDEKLWRENFSAALKESRKKQKLTFQQAASRMNVETRQFERWERGESAPGAYNFERLIHQFNLDEKKFHVTK